jgi:hypothetical protein
VFFGSGDGTFQPPVNFPAGGQPMDLLADFQRRGKLISPSSTIPTIRPDSSRQRHGNIWRPTSIAVGPNPVPRLGISIDGRPDLVVENPATLHCRCS